MQADVITLDNSKVGSIELAASVFGVTPRADILHRMVRYQLAKRRQGSHKVKRRAEVRGSSAKPFRQKGTGRARQGSRKGPHMRGGGVVFGPTPRDHGHDLPKKIRRLAMRMALSAKKAEDKLVILEEARLDEGKTRNLAGKLAGLGWDSVLIVSGPEVDENLKRAARNLPRVDVLPQEGANVYDILRRDVLALTRSAVDHLEARLK